MSFFILGFAARSLALVCPSDHYAVGNICVDCPTGIRWCVSCTGPGQCTHCQPGYYLDNGYCKPCDSLCTTCDGPNSCITCHSNYCKDSSDACTEPGEVYEGCKRCAFETNKCIMCHDGYFFDTKTTTCTKCKDNCDRCKSTTECEEPSSGYYLDKSTGTITPCADANCRKCSKNASTCDVCADGYSKNSSNTSSDVCTKCTVQNCRKCPTLSTCEACNKQYVLANGICKECAENCWLCAINGIPSPGNCHPDACFDGYRYDPASKRCVQCPTNCAWCLYDSARSETICERCKATSNAITGPNIYGVLCTTQQKQTCREDQFQENEDCVPCTSIIIGCHQCTDKFHCTKCMKRYYLVDNVCVACDKTCYECEGTPSNCLSCDRVNILQGNTCVPIGTVIPNCAATTPGRKEPTCRECVSGYYPNNDQCFKCADFCSSCGGPEVAKCWVPMVGYRVNRTESKIEKCTVENCWTCHISTDRCSLCAAGYTLSRETNSCTKGSIDNCALYLSSPDRCSTCTKGYGVAGTGNQKCEPCQKECIGGCYVSTSCDSGVCEDGFYYSYNTSKCVACPDGCLMCKQHGNTSPGCTRCKSGAIVVLTPNYGLHCDTLPIVNKSGLQSGVIAAIVILVLILIGLCIALPFIVKILVRKNVFRKGRAIKFDHESADSLLPEGSGSAL